MSNLCVLRSAALAAASLALVCRAPAQYTVSQLPEVVNGTSTPLAVHGGQVVGSGGTQAVLWNGTSGSVVGLGLHNSQATCFYGNQQGGYYHYKTVYGGRTAHEIFHAVIWNSTSNRYVDLEGSNSASSYLLGMAKDYQVGVIGSMTYGQAVMWKGAPGTRISLHQPAWYYSAAYAADGNQQVGDSWAANGSQATLWTGSAASAVILHPADLVGYLSAAYGVDAANDEQVGAVWNNVTGANYAYLWHGSADTAVNLHPAIAETSSALGVRGPYQVGYITDFSRVKRAAVWQGSASSYIDLSAFLPAGYSGSVATCVDDDGTVYGYGIVGGTIYGPHVPLVWRPTVAAIATASQSPNYAGTSWLNQTLTVTLTSPYTTPGASISYLMPGATSFTTVRGTGVNLDYATDGSTTLQYYASDGLGHQTETKSCTFNLDLIPPKTVASEANFIVTLKAYDFDSGVSSTHFSLDGASAQTGTTLAVTNENHILKYWSIDLAGNVEPTRVLKILAKPPVLSSISPTQVLSGTAGFTMTLTGVGFTPRSQVLWNGSPVASTYVSSTSMTVAVTDAMISSAQTVTVQVTNPSPGIGTSAAITFTVFQQADATGPASDIGDGGNLTLSPVTSSSGFTLTGSSVHVATNSSTVFHDINGNVISETTFFDTLTDNQTVSVVGVYSGGTITAWSIQMH